MSSVIASPVGRSNPEVRGLSPCNAGIASSRLLLAMTSTPTYTWNKVNGSTYYYLYVNGPSGNVISKWYTPAEANCDSASSTTCTITPTTTLANGSHTWWIQTWNPIGTGPWSSAMYFTVQSQGYAPKKVLAMPAVMDTVVATFTYDGDGNRVSQTIGGVTTYFVSNYYEKTGSTITKYYYAGTQRVAMRQGSTLYYLMSDHLGSTSLTVNTSGSLVAEIRYKAWGETRYTSGTLPTKYTYTGQYSNVSDFGWMYYNARWYDPSLGRFAQADTVVPAGVQGYDRYAYTNNSPVRYTDPSGHACVDGTSYCVDSRSSRRSGSLTSYNDAYTGGRYHELDPRDGTPATSTGTASKTSGGICGAGGLYDCPPGPTVTSTRTIPIPSDLSTLTTCTSTHPCILHDDSPIQDPSTPDYWSLQGTVVVWAGSATVDRYGNVYWAPLGVNVGSSIIEGGSVAFVAGYVQSPVDDIVPTESQMESYLTGPTVTISGGAVGGGGITWSPWAESSGDAFAPDHFSYEGGIYTPQIGVTGTWGFMLIDNQ